MRKFGSLVGCLAVLMLTCASEVAAGQLIDVSLPRVDTTPGERVVGFEVVLKAARIHSLREVPYGWYLTIDNPASLSTRVGGAIHVGAAAVDLNFLDRLIVIEKREDDLLKFSIEMKIYVTVDFVVTRQITLQTEDISLVAR